MALFCFLLFFAMDCQAYLRDPTRPENYQESLTNPVQVRGLQAIIISSRRKIAIYNGRVLRLGSQLSGFKVMEIQANTVHMEGPDGRMTLFLFNQTIKKETDRAS